MICVYCLRELKWVNEWVRYKHIGGGAIMQYCAGCSKSMTFERPLPKCPECGVALVDSHYATPRQN
jgi:hypothetical protein